jgi:ATP-binding cassette subfamily C (CFTR/MRP) protein 1
VGLFLQDHSSRLDATTRDRTFDRLFTHTGILCKNNIAVVLVTFAADRLSFADSIIVLDSEAYLVE